MHAQPKILILKAIPPDTIRVPEARIALDHVVLLPHVRSASHRTRRAMGDLPVDNLASWFAGHGPVTPVAETPWPSRADRSVNPSREEPIP